MQTDGQTDIVSPLCVDICNSICEEGIWELCASCNHCMIYNLPCVQLSSMIHGHTKRPNSYP
jgi:hypothetical protein